MNLHALLNPEKSSFIVIKESNVQYQEFKLWHNTEKATNINTWVDSEQQKVIISVPKCCDFYFFYHIANNTTNILLEMTYDIPCLCQHSDNKDKTVKHNENIIYRVP